MALNQRRLLMFLWLTSVPAAVADTGQLPPRPERSLINFSERQNVNRRRPLIIAHRGGVISPRSAECSLTAIQLAADEGYDMVELDIQKSRDAVPIVFHDRNLAKACGKNGRIEDASAVELESVSYLVGDDRIVRLDTALELCRRLGLGVMLDLKAGRDSPEFLAEIDRLLVKHELTHASISISGSGAARRFLRHVRFTATDEEMRRLRAGEQLDLSHRFWFGLPQRLQPDDVRRLRAAGALVIPAINTFRYPKSDHLQLARDDIRRLTQEGVDGFQIDSVYYRLVSKEE